MLMKHRRLSRKHRRQSINCDANGSSASQDFPAYSHLPRSQQCYTTLYLNNRRTAIKGKPTVTAKASQAVLIAHLLRGVSSGSDNPTIGYCVMRLFIGKNHDQKAASAPIQSIFRLAGNNEDSLTYVLGFLLARDSALPARTRGSGASFSTASETT